MLLAQLLLQNTTKTDELSLYSDENACLEHTNEGWIVRQFLDSEQNLEHFDRTACALLDEKIEGIREEVLVNFVRQFNTRWTLICLKSMCGKERRICAIKDAVPMIEFNSYNETRWLSNFFRTLIYDKKNGLLYPSVESGYVSFKARKKGNLELSVDAAKEFDPKSVKVLGADPDLFWQRVTSVDNTAAKKEMARLELLKFTQNPVLKDLLIKTSKSDLVEKTGDPYWGRQNNFGKNRLGKILEATRSYLQKDNP
ncbi:MAG: NADAR family protein [Waddliaceae bacterium]